jgi:hypothetical protein
MPSLLIRNVSEQTVARLKRRARRHGRSLQAEALAALEADAPYSGNVFADELERLWKDGRLGLNLDAALASLHEDRMR